MSNAKYNIVLFMSSVCYETIEGGDNGKLLHAGLSLFHGLEEHYFVEK